MGARPDRGSLAIEYVIAAPLLLLVFALIFAFARVGEVDGQLDSATRDAARTVTQLPDLSQAAAVAHRVVADQLGSEGEGGCSAGTVRVAVTATRPDGQPDAVPAPGDTVTVTSSCPYSLTDLGLPVPMGDLTAHSQFSSVVDPNRSG
ncbi:MAG TPA: TadE/TadG family type IV pilus assembly protein [Jatrophihabitans sp.]|nr:TadE/TadG family type IV pilus assembly protein [Jatrophihabitans sp.]